ncbi:dTDP-L-rhamnose 4-epimerase [Leifsonia sp. AK011]|uniref:NAD-dependent epimerase/dehydratase family protein n=1 Tax=Leifsonia sp. AK011 TaxID=2723075 RepID=UPI0015CAD209|nr:NAD-dependent epimerase/dehydratase family protein [Leifsonia sp. AK011]NYF11423.1 dTDP-L-rhamnose 4-epimerase [Leifsonia sp. AK011]
MRILVTGGAGFIGSQIVEAARSRGDEVVVLDSLRPDVHGPSASIGSGIRADVRDTSALADALRGVDVVCHQAAKVGLGVDFSDAPDYVSSNDLGTATLLAAMAGSSVRRLVLASSMVVYGEGAYGSPSGPVRPSPRLLADLEAGRFDPLDADGTPLVPELIDENFPLDPRNVYAATKLAQEHLASAWARSTGGVVIALRYHNVYGPGMPSNTPYAGVASLFRSAVERGEAPRVFEDGRQRRDFVHVRDVASANLAAIDAAMTAGPGHSRAFNVASGEVHTIHDLASAITAHAHGVAPVVTGEFRLGDVRHITASSARLRAELGWRPTVTFEEGMREFATALLREAVA